MVGPGTERGTPGHGVWVGGSRESRIRTAGGSLVDSRLALTVESDEALGLLGVVLGPHEAADDEIHLGGDQ